MKKRHINIFAAVLAAILCLGACKLEAPAIFITVAITYDADEITEESAVLKGAVRLPDTLPDDTQYGFLLSLSESVLKSDSQEIVVFSQKPLETEDESGTGGSTEGTKAFTRSTDDGDGAECVENEESGSEAPAPTEFSARVVGFDAGTTYYFRSFALCSGFYSYGAVVSFTTAGTPAGEEQTDESTEPSDDSNGTEPTDGALPSDNTGTVEQGD